MSKNIVLAIQERLGLNSFDKIDPNLQNEKNEFWQSHDTNHYSQAAVIAVLVGMYKYASTQQGAEEIFKLTNPNELLSKFLGDEERKVIEAVSYYGNKPYDFTQLMMEKIAQEAVKIAAETIGEEAKPNKIKSYILSQRRNILVYLPPDLQLGILINDNSIDDRTNKMEGPISGFMHFAEKLFAEKDK